jgi:hypothetical protein
VDLTRVLPGHDHEVVSESRRRAEIEHDEVEGFAILCGIDGALNLWRKLP